MASVTVSAVTVDLDTAGRLALERSTALRSLNGQYASAALTLKLGIRDWLPQVSLGYMDSSNVVIGGPDSANIQWTMTLSQPIFDGGRSMRNRKLQEADLALSARGIKDKEREILESVDSAYHTILMLRRKIAIQREVLSVTDQELEIARTLRLQGALRQIDLIESELERNSLAISIESSESDLEKAIFDFRQLIGMSSDAPVELVDDFDAEYAGLDLPQDDTFFQRLLEEGNLEMRQRQSERRKKLSALIEAREWYLPNVSFEGTLSISGERYPLQSASLSGKLIFEIPTPTSPVSFSLSASESFERQRSSGSSIGLDPLSEYSGVIGSIIAQKEYALLLESIEAMDEALAFELRRSVMTYERDRRSLALLRQDLELKRKKSEILKKQVDIGDVTRLEYIKALIEASESESSILEAVLGLRKSERTLERILGIPSGALAAIVASRKLEEAGT